MNPPKMPLHIGDYRRDTSHLSVEQHGAYFLLIMHYWSHGSLPDDDSQLARVVCMTPAQWRRHRPILGAFFHDGWRHKRIDADLAAAKASYERRAKAGQSGGKAKAESKQCSSIATALPEQPLTLNQEPEKKDPGANAPAADPRADLFGRGLRLLAESTGRTPDSCRSLIGKWLKTAQDEAIHVLAAIEDAHRNRIADPTGWITNSLKAHFKGGRNGSAENPNSLLAAIDRQREKIGASGLDYEPELDPVLSLPPR